MNQLANTVFDRGMDLLRRTRALAPGVGALPDFIILGAQKAGTTSLHALIAQHPEVRAPLAKEIHFFDVNYWRGERWYRSFFPRRERMAVGSITGEASPYYLFHPHCPDRIRQLLPEARLIVVVRNPVARAISQYHHEVRLGFEDRGIEEALAAEAEIISQETARLEANPGYYSFAHQHHSYRERGLYADQIERYYERFPRDQVLIVDSQDLYRNPAAAAQATFDFLGIDPTFAPPRLRAKNVGSYKTDIDPAVTEQLAAYYVPHNRRFFDLIGRDLDW